MFTTPVLLISFKRPDKTKQILERLRQCGVVNLYCFVDGPRQVDQETAFALQRIDGDITPEQWAKEEAQKCHEVRDIIMSERWADNLICNFQAENVGGPAGALGPLTAINWFFNQVEEGIILEDDCLPSADFFRFSTELLEKYRSEPRVMMIAGFNCQHGRKRGLADYYFSDLTLTWGWASWRRAWSLNKYEFYNRGAKHPNWDVAWRKSVRQRHGLCAVSNYNLITNVGIGNDSIHNKEATDGMHFLPAVALPWPLRHPKKLKRNWSADLYTQRKIFYLTYSQLLREEVKYFFLHQLHIDLAAIKKIINNFFNL